MPAKVIQGSGKMKGSSSQESLNALGITPRGMSALAFSN